MALELLSKHLHLIVLPSTLWAIHIDPEYNFVAILHVQLKISHINIDKGVILTYNEATNSISASFLICNKLVEIPTFIRCVTSAADVSQLIYLMNSLKVCVNADNYKEYEDCAKYVGFGKSGMFCQACSNGDENLWNDFNTIDDIHSLDESTEKTLYNESLINDPTCRVEKKQPLLVLEEGTKEVATAQKSNKAPRKFPCKFCDKNFLSKSHLEEHLHSHIGEKPFLCNICNKTSSRKSSHQRHMLTHSTTKCNLCNICGKTFYHAYQMKDHLLTHSSERPFQCETCNKGFTRHYYLKLHRLTHSGVRSFSCDTCGKTYTTQSNLSTHIRSIHTKKKPHTCSNCNMSFVHPRYLRIHMRKHTGEKPYKCLICEKTFAKNIHLKIHTRTHTGEKPHVCSICNKGFITTGNLSSHKRVHHKETILNVPRENC